MLAQTVPWTLTLVGTATVITFVLGTLLGILAGWRHGGWLDRSLPGLMFLQAIPYFFLALVLLDIFAVKVHWFPLGPGVQRRDPARLALDLHRQRHPALAAAGAHDRRSRPWLAGCCRCGT